MPVGLPTTFEKIHVQSRQGIIMLKNYLEYIRSNYQGGSSKEPPILKGEHVEFLPNQTENKKGN